MGSHFGVVGLGCSQGGGGDFDPCSHTHIYIYIIHDIHMIRMQI